MRYQRTLRIIWVPGSQVPNNMDLWLLDNFIQHYIALGFFAEEYILVLIFSCPGMTQAIVRPLVGKSDKSGISTENPHLSATPDRGESDCWPWSCTSSTPGTGGQGKEGRGMGRSRGRKEGQGKGVCTQEGAAEWGMKKGEKQENQSPGNILGMLVQ